MPSTSFDPTFGSGKSFQATKARANTLAEFHYPDMHPSPLDAPSPELESNEQSWFYYLTEITLRHIGSRVLNTLYCRDHYSWTDEAMPFMAKWVDEFEQQLQDWYAGFPSLIQFERCYANRGAATYGLRPLLEIKVWIYRQFIYYAIHNPPNAPCQNLIPPYVEKSLTSNLHHLHYQPVLHRHDGTLVLHKSMHRRCSAFTAVRSGTIHVPAGWRAADWDRESQVLGI
ncbi:hypothetical protein V1517DRAFT_373947 [Lipomyces orientalis]|uniref:Uncharacterized protein n=1 Tax=Lipomyces orientalis TaxID=1233043 RepID=A0ACC3TMC4_9ASCO